MVRFSLNTPEPLVFQNDCTLVNVTPVFLLEFKFRTRGSDGYTKVVQVVNTSQVPNIYSFEFEATTPVDEDLQNGLVYLGQFGNYTLTVYENDAYVSEIKNAANARQLYSTLSSFNV